MNIAFRQALPNPMFPDEITALIRFACTDEDHPCAVCGKGGRFFWTMLVPFAAAIPQAFSMQRGPELEALTLVCAEHHLSESARFRGAIGLDPDPPGDFEWEGASSDEAEDEESWDSGSGGSSNAG